jgi:DNA-binding response OmpR family regulator
MMVLYCLMREPGEAIGRHQIVMAIGADYLSYDPRSLNSQILRLRSRVAEFSGQSLPVKTLRNVGYCFTAPARVAD